MNGIVRPKLLPKPVANYAHAWSVYPDEIRVSFENGQTVKYVVEIQQPEPVLGKMLDRFNHICFGGYKYKDKGRGKRSGHVNAEHETGCDAEER